ncbi:MAG: 50S ribosomal protein L10 [Candidatus Omnitrophota bacterium]
MKKIGIIIKEEAGKYIKNKLKDSPNFFIIRYSGVAGLDLSSLRQDLRSARASLFVAKNSVARRALKENGLEDLSKKIEGPSGFVFIEEDPVQASKSLFDFSKSHEQLKVEGGFLKDKILHAEDVEAISKLPSKEVLRAQVVMILNSPIRNIVIVLNQTLRKFVYCLDQIKTKKTN